MSDKADKAIEYYQKGEWKKAIDTFSSVLETNGDSAEVYNNIAQCYAQLGDDDNAEHNFLKAQKLNPKLPQVYINLSDIYYLEHILKKQRKNYDAYYDLGRVHLELGNYSSAIRAFENVLEYKKDNE